LCLAASVAHAQQGATANVTLAPIQCWSRTSTDAIRVGEQFTLYLTCAVVQTESTTVVPDQSRLDPGALQVPPFEVVNGAQAPDLQTRTHRYFQYEYVLRFIGEQIGTDVELPGPTINYRVQSRVQADSAVESRERQYVLPGHRIRVASLVPLVAGDIHDEMPATFRQIEDRRFRGSLLRIVSWMLFGIAAVMAMWAATALVRRPQTAESVARRALVPEAAVLRVAMRELDHSRQQRQTEGWTPELAARVLAALRLAASFAVGRPVAQTPVTPDATPGAGQVLVTSWFPRRRRVLTSGSATAESLVGAGLQTGPHNDDLRVALERFAAAAYGRSGVTSESDLDEALERGSQAVARVAGRYTWLARTTRSVRQSAMGVRDRAWAR
jgi:hypothetical protein